MKLITIRCHEEEIAAWKEAARLDNRKLSNWVKTKLNRLIGYERAIDRDEENLARRRKGEKLTEDYLKDKSETPSV